MFFPDKLAAYREVLRVLKPGGRFLFNVWNALDLNPVSRIVSELEEHGLVERVIDAGDARASVATITAAGRQELRRAAPVYFAGIDAHFNRYLTVPQRTAVARALQRVVDAHAEQIDPRR